MAINIYNILHIAPNFNIFIYLFLCRISRLLHSFISAFYFMHLIFVRKATDCGILI